MNNNLYLVTSLCVGTLGIATTRIPKTFIYICALLCWVATVSLRTLTSVGSSVIEAAGIPATGIVLALVRGATVSVGITSGTRRTLAQEPSVLIDTLGSSTARVAQTLIEVHTLQT